MPAQPKAKLQIFGENETLDDVMTEVEETGEQQPAPTPEPAQEAQPAQGPAQEATPEPLTKGEERYRQLVEQLREKDRQLNESNEKWARLDERRRQIDEARTAAERQAKQAAERPDPSIDPVGAQLFDTRQELSQLKEWRQQQEQQFGQLQQVYAQDRQTQDFNNWVVAEAQSFAQQQPDYQAAAQHAANWRMDWWQQLGLPQDQARQMVMHESNLLAQISRQTGRPFAPIIYKLAQSVGYQGVNGNGARPTSAAASAAGRTLSQVAKGQAMQGLGRAPSAGAEAKSRYRDYTAADIANMSEKEWVAAMADPVTRRELMYANDKADGILPEDR